MPAALGRTCKKCGADHWHVAISNGGQRTWRCGKCAGRQKLKWKLKNRDKYREWSWKQRGINITLDEYRQKEIQQGGACAVCHAPHPKLVVDHCHKTGKVRALLCRRCNGIAQEPEIVRAVLSYMELHE